LFSFFLPFVSITQTKNWILSSSHPKALVLLGFWHLISAAKIHGRVYPESLGVAGFPTAFVGF